MPYESSLFSFYMKRKDSVREAKMLKPGTLIDWNWHETLEGKEAFSSFYLRNSSKRRVFGLLEKPAIPNSINTQEVRYKIAVIGKSGVGKSSTIANLCGLPIPSGHMDTPGFQVNAAYWLARLKHTKTLLLFHLDFWDAGEASSKRFDHVLPACKDKSDAVLFLFSHVNRASFRELPQTMNRVAPPDDNVCRLVCGTKFDLQHQAEVAVQDVQEFEKQYKVPVMKIKNVPASSPSSGNGQGFSGPVGGSTPGEIIGLMNAICEQLWLRDQILAGVIGGSQDLPGEIE